MNAQVLEINESTSTFRSESFERIRHSDWSSPLNSRSVAGSILLITSITSVLLLVWAASFIEIARKDFALGHLTPADGSWIYVTASYPNGVVTELLVTSGTSVKRGETLAVISSNLGDESGREVPALRQAHLEQQSDLYNERLGFYLELQLRIEERKKLNEEYRTIIDQQYAEVLHSENNILSIIQKRRDVAMQLQLEGVITQSEMANLEYELQKQKGILSQIERERIVDQSKTDIELVALQESEIRSQLSTNSLQSDLLNIATLQLNNQIESSQHILAPVDGMVAATYVGIGDSIERGQVLLDIVPNDDNSLEAKLYVDSSSAAQLQRGDDVKVEIQGFPRETYGEVSGIIQSVSMTSVPREQVDVATPLHAPLFNVRVIFPNGIQIESKGFPIQLRPGMPVSADLVFRRETVLEWLTNPLKRATSRV